jgi:hypothetical protein
VCTPRSPPRCGRRFVIDTIGLLLAVLAVLAVLVTAASVQDSVAGTRLLDQVAAEHPAIRKVWVDGGYRRHLVEHAATLGIDMEIATISWRDPKSQLNQHISGCNAGRKRPLTAHRPPTGPDRPRGTARAEAQRRCGAQGAQGAAKPARQHWSAQRGVGRTEDQHENLRW